MFDGDQRGAVAGLGGLSSEGAAFWSHAVIRTRFFDDYLLDPTGQGIRQVVLLAAGLDTRAYRLVWPASVRLFELDLAEVLELAACPGRAGCRRDGTAPATRSAISSLSAWRTRRKAGRSPLCQAHPTGRPGRALCETVARSSTYSANASSPHYDHRHDRDHETCARANFGVPAVWERGPSPGPPDTRHYEPMPSAAGLPRWVFSPAEHGVEGRRLILD